MKTTIINARHEHNATSFSFFPPWSGVHSLLEFPVALRRINFKVWFLFSLIIIGIVVARRSATVYFTHFHGFESNCWYFECASSFLFLSFCYAAQPFPTFIKFYLIIWQRSLLAIMPQICWASGVTMKRTCAHRDTYTHTQILSCDLLLVFRFWAPKRWFKRTVFCIHYIENMIGLCALALVCIFSFLFFIFFWIHNNAHIKTHIQTRKRLNNLVMYETNE